jgi:hypothetical protein
VAQRRWTIATARQHLPALIASAAREPQRVYRRAELVATVVSPETAAAIAADSGPSLADELADLQRICSEEDYELPVVKRQDRRRSPGPLAPPAQKRGQARR